MMLGVWKMNESSFWQLIETTRTLSQGVGRHQAELLIQNLEEMATNEIIEFDEIFRKLFYQAWDWRLWGAASLVKCYCSEDSFKDFIAWLIGQGQKVFQSAIENPDSLFVIIKDINGIDIGSEELLYVAEYAYEHKTGDLIPIQPLSGRVTVKGDKKTIEEWIEDYPYLGTLYKANCGSNS
jgi:hypothetical protein